LHVVRESWCHKRQISNALFRLDIFVFLTFFRADLSTNSPERQKREKEKKKKKKEKRARDCLIVQSEIEVMETLERKMDN
jgi:hypothetical protein